MKILYLTGFGDENMADYLRDMTLHGLRNLFGENVVDYPGCWTMYKDELKKRNFNSGNLWGKGFNIYGTLTNYNNINRSDIKKKIEKKFFDLVIFGSIRRSNKFLDEVIKYNNKFVFIDGEDDQFIDNKYSNKSLYFKRELLTKEKNLLPISFSVPKEKIIQEINNKPFFLIAPLIPGYKKTYIYNDEKSYNNMYEKSLFAITTKKAGWDCLRHYEILMNGCIPLFLNIKNCPELTCTNLPKKKISHVNEKYLKFLPKSKFERAEIKKFRKFHNLVYEIKQFMFKEIEVEKFIKKFPEIIDIKYELFNYTKKNLTTEIQTQDLITSINKNFD